MNGPEIRRTMKEAIKKTIKKAGYASALVLLLAVAGALDAQHRQRMTIPSSESRTLTAEGGVAVIPFELVNNHMIISVSINGSEPLDIVLDTGMPAPGLVIYESPETKTLDLDIDPGVQAQVGGAGGNGERLTAKIAMSESLLLSGLEIDGSRIIVMPEMPHMSGYHDGIMGYSLFANYAVELDYDESVVRLVEPETYRPPSDAAIVPLTFRANVPYATVTVTLSGGEPFDGEVVVDLGASHALSLNRDHADDITLPEATVSAIIGRGVSGIVRGEVGRIDSLVVGGSRLEDLVVTFPAAEHQNPRGIDSLAGNLGSEVLRRFNTTFDYANERMILVPNRSHSEPFLYDRSGLRLATGDRLTVEGVIEGSPAADAGVEVGDLVTHVNGDLVSSANYAEVRAVLMGSGDVRLSLERGDTKFDKTVRLRRLI